MDLTKSAFCKSVAGVSRSMALSCALIGGAVAVSPAPAHAEDVGLWDKMLGTVGLGAKPADQAKATPSSGNSVEIAPVQATPARATPAPVQPTSARAAPSQAVPAQAAPTQAAPAPVAVAPQKPGMFDNVLGVIGIGGPKPSDTIDYSERPKLAVPQQRVLPPPRDSGGPRPIAKNPESEALIKPPAEYMEKVRGADGEISGLKDGDFAKDKKFFGLF
jgi:hypothetical protein